uniref:Putative flavin-containing amine oxidase n=1 Tax=Rhodnius prolixus TaxID=13249 RepID=R4G3E2_RHOPR
MKRKQETIESPRKDRTLDCYKEIKSRLKIKEPLAVSAECGEELPKVIILGAGLAGLSAAYHLLKHGHNNVVILEASERIGGRILTTWMGDTVIELGDSVINGANVTNSVYNLANMEGLAMHKIPENYPVTYITSDSRLVSDYFIQEQLFKEMLEQAKEAYKKIGFDCSVLDYLAVRIQQEMLNFPSHMRYDSERLMFGMINNLKAVMGTELNKVGTQHFGLINKISGGDVRITQGFCALLAQMIRQLPAEWFQFGKEVKSVEWGGTCEGTPQVVVNCNEDEVFKGNFVIVTLPLGVIKKKVNCMFLPKLPKGKVNAINGLSVGHTNNVYLEYSNPWWVPEELNMRIAWSPREHKQSSSWTKGIGKIQEVPNSKRVIMFTVGGEEALSMESYTEVEIAVEFTKFLRKLIGDKTIPFPNNIALYRWSCNSHFLGSTVYMPTGSSKGMIKDFFSADCQEIDSMPILFAGKAAHERYFGTIHGARMSAIREAERILKLIKVLKQRGTCTLEIAEDEEEEVCVCHS